jgi:F-type H+-transporting ATPase subunit epsilon
MKATVRLEVVSLEAEIFSGLAEMVVVTGTMGELGILPGHIPFLTMIRPGQIRITLPGNIQDIYYISGGLMEVQPDMITVLADTIIRAVDLDEIAAIAARENAEHLLRNKISNVDFTNALVQIAQATAKLHTIELLHKTARKLEK